MTNLREAAQMALEAMAGYRRELDMLVGHGGDQPCDAERALSAALAQPEQEPVAHVCRFDKNGRPDIAWDNCRDMKIGTKLYTAPPQREWQGLTDEEEIECYRNATNHSEFARAIEAKLKEKNGNL